MNIVPVALHFSEQLSQVSSVLADELQQLVASLQAMLGNLVAEVNVIEAGWTDIPYSSTNYSTNSAGLITPSAAAPNVYRYKVVGKTMWLNCTATVTIGNAATSEIRFTIPGSKIPSSVKGAAGVGDNVQRTAGVYYDSAGVAGVVLASINTVSRYISVQRYDGAPAAVYVNGRAVTVGFMVQIPLT